MNPQKQRTHPTRATPLPDPCAALRALYALYSLPLPLLLSALCLLTTVLCLPAAPSTPATSDTGAPSARWEPATGTLAKGQDTILQLVFENCWLPFRPKNTIVDLPGIIGVYLFPNGRYPCNYSYSNEHTTYNFSYSVIIRPASNTRITIPAFKTKTNKGEVIVPAANFDVSDDINAVTIPPRPSPPSPRLAFEQPQVKSLMELLRDSRVSQQSPATGTSQPIITSLTAPVTLAPATDKIFPPAINTTGTSKPTPDFLGTSTNISTILEQTGININTQDQISRPPPTDPSIFLPLFEAPKPNKDTQEK